MIYNNFFLLQSNHIKNSCLASDVVKLGEYVKPFDTSDPQYQSLLRMNWELIDIVDVFSPSFFWIHLHKLSPSAPSAFEDMMNELHYFYEEKKTEYTIHIEYAVGLNVACKFDQSWHRGIIKEIITAPEKKAKVSLTQYIYMFFLFKNISNLLMLLFYYVFCFFIGFLL